MITVNMLSKADQVKGHGVLSAHDEQVRLVKDCLSGTMEIYENSWKRCDVTHFHTVNPTFMLRIPLAKWKGSAVGHVHFLPETVEKSLRLPRLFKQVFYFYLIFYYKRMDYLVTVNPYFIKSLMAYGIRKERISYIPNFVSHRDFHPMEPAMKEGIREKYNLDRDRFTVLCVGQLQARKGIADFIEVAKQMPDIQFVWAGGFTFGPISSGYDETKEILAHCPQNIHFLGLIDHSLMNEVYNLADVMFLPSYEELFPMAILESMNCGLPILLRDLREYQDVLFDSYLKGTDVEGFIGHLERLSEDKVYYQEAVRMSVKGSEFYRKENVSAMWSRFYLKAASVHRLSRKRSWRPQA